MRLIDGNEAIINFGFEWDDIPPTREEFVRFLKKQPTVDAVEVVHGRWKEMHYEGGILDGTNFDRCSVCGYERVFDAPEFKTVFKYCPNCGAKMDGGAE